MGKNLVVCCDGTSNQFGDRNTNVVHLFSAIERDLPDQVAFYDPGVGTAGAMGSTLGEPVGKFLGVAFGYGVRKNIEDAYRFLMNNYEAGDRVFLFGFSRGAFTARSIAAMLREVGLLHPQNENLVRYASKRFLERGKRGENEDFKRTFSRECRPYFVGVWDTVGSLGWFIPLRRFRDADLSPDVSHAYHAVAIDEKRSKFPPTLWDESNLAPEQTVRQVWFAGVHADVGGGYPERGLADISLRWMLKHARRAGLKVRQEAWDEIDPDPLGKLHRSYKSWWKLLGRRIREVPREPDRIHESVWRRREGDSSYTPANLPVFEGESGG